MRRRRTQPAPAGPGSRFAGGDPTVQQTLNTVATSAGPIDRWFNAAILIAVHRANPVG